MSNSAAVVGNEVNVCFQDENGKILKVLKKTDNKQEEKSTAASLYITNNVSSSTTGAYRQMNSGNQAFVRIQNNYNAAQTEDSTYTVIAPQTTTTTSSSSNGGQQQQHNATAIKYDYERPVKYNKASNSSSVIKTSESYPKYTQSSSTSSKLKSKAASHSAVQRKRKPEKAGKGLRHFSMKVCEKVKEKGTTTYNEVADELVTEEIQNNSFDSANCDQKNIRRRVYDALNVLMAMQIISKDKKEIRWIGLPTNSIQKCNALEVENEKRRQRIEQKHQQLRELLLQQVSFKSLIRRNKEAERQGIIPTPNSSIQLPFIIVNTHKTTKINCSVTNDKSEYIFKFDDKFEMHDDAEVLKRMGLLFGLDKGDCSTEDIERAKTLVPPNFEKYIEAYGRGEGVNCNSDDDANDDIIDEDMSSYIEYTNDSQSGFSRTDGGKSPNLEDEEFLENSDID